jgi:rod shape-determining protein MreC
VVIIVALLLAVGLTVVGDLTNLNIGDMLVKGILTPIRTGASRLTDQAQQLYNYMFRYESLVAENESLKEQIAQLEEDARMADSISRENDRLRDALSMKEAREDFNLVDCYIISRSSQEWSSTFTVNRGSAAGIQTGMCVVTANSEVVGLVSEVGPNYAVVRSVMDSSLEISATIASSGYNGMVQGGYASGLQGLLRMDYLPSNSVIRNNDQVVTSGSTVYPRNLIIGYVVDADFDDTGVAKYALLKPAVNVGELEQVFVVTAYEVG